MPIGPSGIGLGPNSQVWSRLRVMMGPALEHTLTEWPSVFSFVWLWLALALLPTGVVTAKV